MKRLILMLALSIITLQATWAKLKITTKGDGTIILTLTKSNDLAEEFTGEFAQTKASDLIKPALAAHKLKIVTESGVKMSQKDLYRLYGESYGNYQHFNVNDLDLSEAVVNDENDLNGLGWLASMKKVTFPATTTKVPNSTFLTSSKSQIEEVIIPDNKDIELMVGEQAFHTNTIKKITFGARKKITIGPLAFQGDTNLKTIDFLFGTKNIIIGNKAFEGSGLENVILPEGVTEIGREAFQNTKIKAIHLPSSLKTIREKAFATCPELRMIVIPEGVEQIETTAFENNFNLSGVYVLGTNTKCAEGAFTDNNAYQYEYKGSASRNGGRANLSDFSKNGNMKTYTVLHIKKAAYDNYVNNYIKKMGTSKEEFKNAGYDESLYEWVTDSKGNKIPVKHSSYFEHPNPTSVYDGWQNFMLVDATLDDEIHDDDKHTNDKWYTMCVPFDIREEQLKSAYGAGVEVVEFSDVDVVTKSNHDKIITLKFKNPVTETKAHHPYMIHPSLHKGTQTGVKTTIVGIKKQEEKQESLDAQKVVKTADGVTYTFIGNYENAKHLQQFSYYYYSGDDETQYKNGFYKWIKSGSGTWTPYTACVLMNKDNGANAKPSVSYYLESIDGQTTAIDTLPVMPAVRDMQQGKVYTITGQLVQQGALDLKVLPQGLYIVNGKKYIVR